MSLILDSFWRAVLYCLHPRVIGLSILPVVLMAVLSLGLGYLFWEAAVAGVQSHLESYALVDTLLRWLEAAGAGWLRAVVAPVVVLFLAIPAIAIVSLLAVAWLMTPAIVSLVADRRFPALERRHGGSMLAGMVRSVGSTVLAFIAIVVSIPLWLVPPLVLILPPLIWGWLTYRVMAYDCLADHASAAERQSLFARHRMALLLIGVLTGYLGAAPGLIFASSALMVTMVPLLVPLAVWIYTLVFAFSALWFTHFCLAALQSLRAVSATDEPPASAPPVAPLALPDDHQLPHP